MKRQLLYLLKNSLFTLLYMSDSVPLLHVCVCIKQPEVIELGVPSSAPMKGCQMAILDLINLCIKEVKLCNPTVSSFILFLIDK